MKLTTQGEVPASTTPKIQFNAEPSADYKAPTIKMLDFRSLSVDDLKKQEKAIHQAIFEKEKAEKAEVIKQIVEVFSRYNIPIEELVEALGGYKVKRRGVKASMKYRDPVTGETWSGRGKEPIWIRDQDRSLYLINT